jgi:hypothetical protein
VARYRSLTSIIAIGASLLGACNQRQPEAKPPQDPIVAETHEDSTGLGAKLILPSPLTAVRWAEIPRSNPRGIGPTDTRLFVLARFAEADWPLWEKALGDSIRRSVFRVPKDVGDGLFPPALRSLCPLDSNGYAVPDPYYRPAALARSLYEANAAARLGGYILMEFASR